MHFLTPHPSSIKSLALLGLILCAWSGEISAKNQVLNTAQIKHLLQGRTIKQVDDQYFAYYQPNGTVKALYVNATESGRWTVARNQICHHWTTWNRGKASCFFVIKGQGGAFRFQDAVNADGFNFVVRQGNNQDL